jgi:hypothetical protein
MIKHLIPLLVITASAAQVQADLVLTQKMESTAMTGEMTMSIKGDLVRTDMGTTASTIMNVSNSDSLTLMHAQKMSMKSNSAQALAAARAAIKDLPPAPVATGKTEKVGDYDCEIYTVESTGMKSTMWICKSFPNWDKIKGDIATTAKMSGQTDLAPLPGMAIKSVTEASGVTTTITLVSAKTDSLDEALFKAPSGYTAIGQ